MQHFTRVLLITLLALLVLPARAGVLSQTTTLTSPVGVFNQYYFGSTGVSISDDGLTFAVATPGFVPPVIFNDGTGAGHAFQYLSGAWNNPGGLLSGPTNGVGYGTGLGLSADGSEFFLGFASGCPPPGMCGGGESPVFANILSVVPGTGIGGSFLDPTGDPSSKFGSTGALSHDGTTMFVGAPSATVATESDSGEVFVYTYSGGVWSGPVTIVDPDGVAGDEFGTMVALSADGTRALIGSFADNGTSTGKAYLYILTAGVWTQTLEFDNSTGDWFICQSCLALSTNGQSAIISTDTGAIVLTQTGGPATWSSLPIATPGGGLGAVAMSADGTEVLIGNASNAAYLYTLSGGIWGSTLSFSDPNTAAGDGFGATGVALSADKQTAVITAGFADVTSGGFTYTQAGLVYVYQSPADLSLALTASATLVALNQQVTLNATVTNNDTTVTAYNVSFAYAIPAGLSFFSALPAGGTCSLGGPGGTTVTCTLPSLAPSATWQPAVTIKVTTAGAYINTTNVTSNQPDPNTANNSASVSISMLPPTVSNGSVTTNADTPVNGTLTGSNPCVCGVPVFSVVTPPAHGTVNITNTATGAFTYTPAAGFIGSDSFTFQLANGLNTSGTATESVTVNDVAPTANNGSVSTTVNTAVSGNLSATPGYAGQVLTYSVVMPPAHGSVTLTASSGAFTYTPTAGYTGSDSFTFTVSDGTLTSGTATESITVNAGGGGGGGGGGGALDWLGLGFLGGLLFVIRRRRS